ncbi:hypothetical protein PCC7424_1537 [Gloeothece citriformis PCC 7424]|uniref:Uncharacterized protein n=1 Tax=Gloeothece citriformis (strain PCC 7424) TaxID=65393 RepID=B7K9K9_GLOC7|nr:hypothetical protein PCC7424_1537 [Gloeothece citriformis PCC 7424]
MTILGVRYLEKINTNPRVKVGIAHPTISVTA